MVIALIAIIATWGLFVTMDFYRSYAFSYERQIVVSVLEKARNQALSNINQAPHGVYFLGQDYIIFQGDSYALRNVNFDQTIPASFVITRSGMQEVKFDQLSGNATVNGGDLQLSDNIAHTASIAINNEGQINW